MSPFWLILAYAIVTLGELMLSPMGLSLVSKVAPISIRGLMMGGWFVATAIGNKLTQIGIYWDIWLQSTFFLVLALDGACHGGRSRHTSEAAQEGDAGSLIRFRLVK